MSWWQWLIEPTHIPILVAIVAFLASIVGGGVAQVIAGLFKTRGDTRQLTAASQLAEAAEKRWEREQEFEREKLQHASIREACSSYLRLVYQLRSALMELHYFDESEVEPTEVHGRITLMLEELLLVRADLQIVAPSIWSDTTPVISNIHKMNETHMSDDRVEWDAARKRLDVTLQELADSMHALVMNKPHPLDTEDKSAHTQPKLDETPMSGKKKQIRK